MKGKKYLVSRREFLIGAGSFLVLVAGGGVWRAEEKGVFDAGTGPAYEPWQDWREGEGALALVSAAILAANAHNTQPWLFRTSEDRIDLFADRVRNLGSVDPLLREMHVSLGCALENLLLAARANGYEHRLTLMPDRADPTHVASVELSPGFGEVSPLYEAIPKRHTNRYAYDAGRTVPAETSRALVTLGRDEQDLEVLWFDGAAERRRVGILILQATQAIVADERQAHDNLAWNRESWDEIQRNRDGLALNMMGASWLARTAVEVGPKPSEKSSNEYWLAATRDRQVATASAFGILTVGNHLDNVQRIKAGRLWQRIHLSATKEELAVQPMNQVHERADRELELGLEPAFCYALADLVGDPDRRGLFTFRVGYPATVAPASPRRKVEAVSENVSA